MIINHNMQALNAHRQMGTNAANAQKSMEKLSSGLNINRAGDDAAGLAISEKMRGQIRGLDQASRNAQDGISMIQTAEGALNETHSILQRMRELSVQSANDTNTADDRAELQKEVVQLKDEIDRISQNTEFNTKKLLNGDLSGNSIGGTGSQIGTATAASIETGDFDPTAFTGGSTENFQVNIDGKSFTVNVAAATDTFDWATKLETALNTAIDTYNTNNPNDLVTKPKFDIEVTDATTMNFKITSGTTGSNSKVEIIALDDAVNTAAQTGGQIQDLFTDTVTSKAGSDGKLNAAVTVVGTDKLELEVNGHKIDVALTNTAAGGASGTYAKDADMEGVGSLAENIQKDIKAALDAYKALTGTDFGNVTVDVKDGAFVISSDKADTTNIQVKLDDVSNKLGLGGTSTSSEGGITLQIGANKDQNINVQINDMSASALKIADVDITTQEGANNSVNNLDEAIKNVSAERSKLGAVQNRLEHTINNLGTSSENLTAAESRIRDVDMAKEMMTMSKNNILNQAAQAMLAQANQNPQQVLQLLR